MYTNLCRNSFGDLEMFPTVETVNMNFGALETTATNLIISNGSEDPW